MIIFCEECGTQHDVSDDCLAGKSGRLTCEGCHETLTVPGAASSIAGPSQKPIRLLIVDDSRLIRAAVRRLFETDGQVQVVGEAANGREALDLLPSLKPDVITLDINMPVMDGFDLFQELRAVLKRDRAKPKAFHVSDLGLVEMSRQRVRPSLYHFMSDQCSY